MGPGDWIIWGLGLGVFYQIPMSVSLGFSVDGDFFGPFEAQIGNTFVFFSLIIYIYFYEAANYYSWRGLRKKRINKECVLQHSMS